MSDVRRNKGQAVVQVEDLAIAYETRKGDVHAVRNVSFDIYRGETLGLVGESGCGKSTVAFGLIGYLGRNGKIVRGDICFQGQHMVGRSKDELRRLRGDEISMVFQDPMTSLNPVLRVGEQMMEVLTVHRGVSSREARAHCVKMLQRVYMADPETLMERYPHQISGGQQQRILIAMAMLNNPALLIMDEPTTALDVTVEAAVLDLIADLRRDFDTAILFITHNLGVIARVCERVGVMYMGEIVEMCSTNELFAHPQHPYTQGLIRCVPKLGRSKENDVLYAIRGRVPPPSNLPVGCTFAPRCDYARSQCQLERPQLQTFSPDHLVRCLYARDLELSEWAAPSDFKSPVLRPAAETMSQETVLEVRDLKSHYLHESSSALSLLGMGKKEYVKAVDGVSLQIRRGQTLGVVGESGCGKSTLIKSLIGLEAITGGGASFLGFDVQGRVSRRDLSLIRELQMVFQNPDSTLNPSYTVGRQIERPLRRFNIIPRQEIYNEVVRLLRAVKLDEHYYDRLPRQLSGGEKQRVGIARAFAGRPGLVLCDEPVSALDVSVQAAVINLLLEIQQQLHTTMVFISHDLSVVRFVSDYIAVMYLGRFMEIGPAKAIYAPPYHPYTESLLAAVPVPDPTVARKSIRLEGVVPSAINPPEGCRFHTRCPRRTMLPDCGLMCEQATPQWQDAGNGHRIACHIPLNMLRQIQPVVSANEGEQLPRA